MRWLFLMLLVVNVGYVAWELNREHPQQSVTTALPAGVERIVLLSELETGTTAQQNRVPESAPVTAAQQAVPEDTAASDLAEGGNAQTQSTPAAVADDSVAAPASKKVASKQAVAALNTPAVMPRAKPTGDICFTLGPFSEMKALRQVTREIKDYVVEASFRSMEEQEQSMFRVFLKPVNSKQESRALIKQLVSKNIRDYFVITDGPNKNGISLGYFSDKGRAHRHAERLRKLGFDAINEPVFRSYTIYWLDYRIKAGNEIPQQIFDQYLENSAQRLGRSCS